MNYTNYEMEKAEILIKDNTVGIHIPISKSNIDVENRIVKGWATIDNVDQMGDKVTAQASFGAFSRFRGNVREMHDAHTAVGKIVKFNQQEFVSDDGKAYTGVFVHVYVSKGAESTWQKVLDGTLNGFSIKGPIKEVSKQYMTDLKEMVQVVTDYDLIELSLVDNPGNELCSVVAIQKNNEIAGMAADIIIDTVYWCEQDRIAMASSKELTKCNVCAGALENIGWYEPTEEVPDQENITKVLQASNKLEQTLEESKGGSEMSEKEEVAKVEETDDVVTTEDVKNEEVSEVSEPDLATIAKSLESIRETIAKASTETREETLSEIQKAVAAVETNVNAKLEELQKGYSKLEGELTVVKDGLGDVEKSLTDVSKSLEKSSAGSKSTTVESAETLEKGLAAEKSGFWSGTFSS